MKKKKERKKEEKNKKKRLMMVTGLEPGINGLRNSRLTWATETNYNYITKYVFIFNMASRTYDLRPVQSLNSNFD